MRRAHHGVTMLALLAVLVVSSFVITLGRVPSVWPDAQFYASIARSLQMQSSGVPATMVFSPTAVDHLPFYGPVYFTLVSLSFSVFGFSVESSRLAGLLGVLLIALGTAVLARVLSEERLRWVAAVSLVLMTPEIGAAATAGDMETVAVGLELSALAAYVWGVATPNAGCASGGLAGFLLLLAALTTPRTYPFVGTFLAVALMVALRTRSATGGFWQFATLLGVFGLGFTAWTLTAHGGPHRWAEAMWFILRRTDSDVAVLATSSRNFAFNWASAITPAAVLVGAVPACFAMRRFRAPDRHELAAGFAFVTTAAAGVVIVWGMDITFSLGMYFAVPVFSVLAALPRRFFGGVDAAAPAILLALVGCDVAIAVVRSARTVATWEARDPSPMTVFLRAHVPQGSTVVGPRALYFFPVTAIGAHYRSFSPNSHADWAKWATSFPAFAPKREPDRTGDAHQRFFIYQRGDARPEAYSCAERIATYTPPPVHLNRLGIVGRSWDIGFPPTHLYRLPADCPVGYDPTGTGQG
jgi:hypothetical protein